jgi:hypothetical protein
MLELESAHIAKLDDAQLRELVRRLCEAELQRLGQPLSSVTAGGNQTASDGGIDVRAEPPTKDGLDFIPRALTGFQVKCEDMPASKITDEMKPGGNLRPSIEELVRAGGAYVIVSSKGSVADSPLQQRKRSMRTAIQDVPGATDAVVDFYDRERLVTWARRYPGIEQWVRLRVGEPLAGWQPYGNWAGDRAFAPYLKDEKGRLICRTSGSPNALTIDEGVEAIRVKLKNAGGIVRLVGLSGVGKTRLVQALFEEGQGATPLDKSIVIYVDQGHSPQPSARDMLLQHAAKNARTLMVVDNCNPDLHRALATTVRQHAACLSLLTVEYDITADEPEETEVFKLTGSSEKVIELVLARWAPHLQAVDRSRIAAFSGGNARIALALTRTLSKGQTLGVLNDKQLLARLFVQGAGSSDALMRAAEVSSLVYSFDCGSDSEIGDELPLLATLLEQTSTELFRQVAELKRRELVQQRGRWRAVLPHAIANQLAKQALNTIPPSLVRDRLETHSRLLLSFSRRLGYLHDSPQACAIAEGWLTDEKWLANPFRLNELGLKMFFNLAPLTPERSLAALEAAAKDETRAAFFSRDWPSRPDWLRLVRFLVTESERFERAARVLLRYAAGEGDGDNTAKNHWNEIFHVALSGTLAPPHQRLTLVRALLLSESETERILAIAAVEAMLKCSHFTSGHDFHFGARPSEYGWYPQNAVELRSWYEGLFVLAREQARPGQPFRDQVRRAVANSFRDLWVDLELHSEVAALMADIAERSEWPDGWAAVRRTIRYDAKKEKSAERDLLFGLEQLLKPSSLLSQIDAYVFAPAWGHLSVVEGESVDADGFDADKAFKRVTDRVAELARAALKDDALLDGLAPRLLSDGSGQRYAFGRYLAESTADVSARWSTLREAFSQIEPENRSTRFLAGFIDGAARNDASATGRILDAAISDPVLASYFPELQESHEDAAAAQRLIASLDLGAAPAARFGWPVVRWRGDSSSLGVYRELVLRLAAKPGGYAPAIDSLGMAFHHCATNHQQLDEELLGLGRDVMSLYSFDHKPNANFDHHIETIAEVCLRGPHGASLATEMSQRFAEALSNYSSGANDLKGLACALFKHHPIAALDAFLGYVGADDRRRSALWRFSMMRESPVNCASDDALLAWAERDPSCRPQLLAAEIKIYAKTTEGGLTWSPAASRLLDIATDKTQLLDALSLQFHPSGWMGSLAEALRPFMEMAEQLTRGSDAVVARWAETQLAHMKERVASDSQRDRVSDERFE